MSNNSQLPILIVGAGPSGLVLALQLKKINPSQPIRLITKASGPSTTTRASIVHARTLELYRQLGIAEDVVSRGRPILQYCIKPTSQLIGTIDFQDAGDDITKYPFILIFPQDFHEDFLVKNVTEAGVTVE